MARYLNAATIMTTPTPRALEVSRATRYAGIEARAERLLEDEGEVRALAGVARDGEIWSLNGVRISFRADGRLDREQLEADLVPRLAVCRQIGAAALLAVPPRVAGLGPDRALQGIRDGLVLAHAAASAVGVLIAFEFLGFADSPIRTPRAAARAVAGIDGVTLVLDSCHWHASGSGPLDEFPVERLAMVHLNDAPDKPPELVEDADRVLPGRGVIRLSSLMAELTARGYAGPWSLETFNPGYWELDPLAIAREGAAAIDAVVGAAQPI